MKRTHDTETKAREPTVIPTHGCISQRTLLRLREHWNLTTLRPCKSHCERGEYGDANDDKVVEWHVSALQCCVTCTGRSSL